MTRYRKTKKSDSAKSPMTVSEESSVSYAPKQEKTINYIWMPDKNGNLVKKDAAFVKRSFASLPKAAQAVLADYVISVQNRQPTDAARKTAFNTIIDAAIDAFNEGKKQSPWDILDIQINNAPKISGPTVTYEVYDKITTDAILRKAARAIGFSEGGFGQFGEQDLVDFFEKVQTASREGAKKTQEIIRPDGTKEIVTIPAAFDADAFAQNYIWSKVNIADPKTLPTSVLSQVDVLRKILRANGLSYLSNKEISNYALQLTKKEIQVTDLQRQFNEKAAEIYPLFGDRLKANPSLTVMDLAEPYINLMAKWWEIDASTIDLDNPDLDKFLRPDGTAGKVPMGSISDWINYLKTHPNAEKTSWANEAAGSLATAFARMSGFGV